MTGLVPVTTLPTIRSVRAHLEDATVARRIGDLAAADAAEIAALLTLRAALAQSPLAANGGRHA